MRRSSSLTILVCRMTLLTLLTVAPALAQHSVPFPHGSPHAEAHDRHDLGAQAEVWEGSAKGIAYSERNHHMAGFMVMLMGIAELSHVLRLSSLRWARLYSYRRFW